MAKRRMTGRKTSTSRRKTAKKARRASPRGFETSAPAKRAAGDGGLEVEELLSAESAEEAEDIGEGAFGAGRSEAM